MIPGMAADTKLRMDFDPGIYLRSLSSVADEDIDLGRAALALAALEQPGISTERYQFHLEKLAGDVKQRHDEFLKSGAQDNAETRLASLRHVLSDTQGYTGDHDTYDDLQNANLIRVIERRKGLPVVLAILYVQAGRAQGWDVCGLDFPGHFLCRIEQDGRRLIFDPFDHCRTLEAADLRSLLKKISGANAELSVSYYEPAGNRAMLIRLQNNIKFRQIEAEDYDAALKTVETMRLVDPLEFRLLLDAGVLYARTGRPNAAIGALESYMRQAPAGYDRRDAALLLRELRESPH